MSEPVNFASPLTFDTHGQIRTVVQNSPADLQMRVLNTCLCVEGEREDNPAFGIPDLTFTQVPLDVTALRAAIELWAETSVTATEAEEAFNTVRRSVTVEIER